jgi:deoxycytidylate deaminase
MGLSILEPDPSEHRRTAEVGCDTCFRTLRVKLPAAFDPPVPETIESTFHAFGWWVLYRRFSSSEVLCPDCRDVRAEAPTRPTRISFAEYAKRLAAEAASRSTCGRAKIGGVAMTADHRILATAYNGAPSGEPHCMDLPEPIVFANHDMICEHTEVNLVDQLRAIFDSIWEVLRLYFPAGMDKNGLFVDWVRSQEITITISGPRECCTYCAKYCYRHGIKAVVATAGTEEEAA